MSRDEKIVVRLGAGCGCLAFLSSTAILAAVIWVVAHLVAKAW